MVVGFVVLSIVADLVVLSVVGSVMLSVVGSVVLSVVFGSTVKTIGFVAVDKYDKYENFTQNLLMTF